GKDKQVYIPKPKNPKPYAKEHPAKDNTCHHCKEVGHCRRNCPAYLAELIKKKMKVGTASSSDVFIIELFYFPTKSWVTKRVKHYLDSTYLWHCHLAHINKKHIKKLQQEGLLKSTDDESFDQCVSCLSGKMTRKSFPHRPERVTDLLGIIHTDVCGPLRHVSRQGASYFITFIDDYSRYGYVYLLKHKHEVFETFKVFKNEVANQLGKTIKAIRSDRGDEYISQEFKDYLKANGIVQQLTPPYTPQHNGVCGIL
ncbi:retrotransposon protein, putative, ty1-copia subclass, partial [Tanacetum coccineum]